MLLHTYIHIWSKITVSLLLLFEITSPWRCEFKKQTLGRVCGIVKKREVSLKNKRKYMDSMRPMIEQYRELQWGILVQNIKTVSSFFIIFWPSISFLLLFLILLSVLYIKIAESKSIACWICIFTCMCSIFKIKGLSFFLLCIKNLTFFHSFVHL